MKSPNIEKVVFSGYLEIEGKHIYDDSYLFNEKAKNKEFLKKEIEEELVEDPYEICDICNVNEVVLGHLDRKGGICNECD